MSFKFTYTHPITPQQIINSFFDVRMRVLGNTMEKKHNFRKTDER